jgi:hypothetical protein
MKMKTSELQGAALHWAVAKCEVGAEFISEIDDPHFYSTDWAQGGPIIERFEIDLRSVEEGLWEASNVFDDLAFHSFQGRTPLIAAMRCYVASKLGDEVELPEELN